MKIKKQELIDVLVAVKPGLAQKAILEQATHFIFTGRHIVTYNDRICVGHPFACDFSCSVPAQEFYSILNRMNDEYINLIFDEGKLKLEGDKVQALLVTDMGQNILPFIASLDLETYKKQSRSVPQDFVDAIKFCSFSASRNMSSLVLACLFIHDDLVAATDDLRISEYKMKDDMGCSMLLPAAIVTDLIKYPIVKFAINKEGNWVYFFTDAEAVFCCRLVDGEFPDYSPFLEGIDKDCIELPDDIDYLIESASILCEDGDRNQDIEIVIQKGKLKCKGQNKAGWIQSQSRVRTQLSTKFTISASFFLDILKYSRNMYFDETKALFKSETFRHVIALKGE